MMTPEELQRTMDFITQSHANAATRMDRFDEESKNTERKIAANAEGIQTLTKDIQALHEDVQSLVRVTNHLASTSEELLDWRRSMKEFMSILVPLVATSAKRIERLEDRSK